MLSGTAFCCLKALPMYDVAQIAAARADFAGARRRLIDALAPGSRVSVTAAFLLDDLDRKTAAIVDQLAVMSGEQRPPQIVEGRRQ